MDHRSIIKWAIVAVVSVVIVWSVVNISEYAHHYHDSWVVWSLGLALGCANALSVYALIIAKTAQVRWAAVTGIILFGGMSGALQMLLYMALGAPLLASIAFGWFGPVAEAVLSWMHAALSEEAQPRKSAKTAQKQSAKPAQVAQDESAKTAQVTEQKPNKVAQRRSQIASANITDKRQIMQVWGVSQRTAETDLAALKAVPVYTNGDGKHG